MSTENSEICNFFQNQTIFITGGSGFIGKIVIEKFLRECQNLTKIYVLLRKKKGKTPEQRFHELFDFPCFDRLKTRNKSALSKVSLIHGDCQKPLLGINNHDLDLLKKETTCVIHAAANVRMTQTLKEATFNVRATKDLLELATQMSKLKVFVFVSTAWANYPYSHIEEDFYDPPMKAENLFDVVDSFDGKLLESITPTLCGKWPNTYVFTKAVSESLIKRFGDILPLVLIRPGCVCSTKEEPMPGWVDNYYGVVGVVAGAYLGLIRSINAIPKLNPNIVPVDYVSNIILAAAWKRDKSTTTNIYNYTGHPKNIITLGHVRQFGESMVKKYPSSKTVWCYGFKMTESNFWHKFWVFFTQTLVAYVIDFFSACLGKPTQTVQKCKKINEMLDSLAPFTTKMLTFNNDNVQELWSTMNDEDKRNFCFDMENFDWVSYGKKSFLGGRLHLFGEKMDVTPEARKRLRMLFIAHYSVLIVFYYCLYKLISFIVCLFWK